MTKPSHTVTIVSLLMGAWFGMSALIGGLQVTMMAFFLPSGFLDESFHDPSLAGPLPPLFQFFLAHFFALAATLMVIFLLTSLCAFGVWRRKEWARAGLLSMLALHIALACAGPAVAVQLLQMNATPNLPGPIDRIPHAFAVIAMLPGLLFATAYGWFFHTLTRPHIRSEFS